MQETCVQSLGQEDLLEEEMATHFKYSCLGNPTDREGSGGLRSMGHKESDTNEQLTHTHKTVPDVACSQAWPAGCKAYLILIVRTNRPIITGGTLIAEPTVGLGQSLQGPQGSFQELD